MKKIVLFGNFIGGLLMFSFVGAEDTTVARICTENDLHTVGGIINWVSCLLYRAVIPLLFALGTAGFIWGVIQFYLNPDNEEKRKKGKSFIVGGLIALFLMVAMWGIVNVFTNTFDLPNTIPQLPGQ
ncbi:TPA: hypothetical protein DCX66_03460 [Candidatus Nomurabacteria bacterium]|uniref:Uncharacterized protein n=1 Tax=Candidatus Nomurabacteria bacterium GW2011_GWE1_35_16 TaxID=1618761 RepID=A0A0G0BC70_9BACT|nr:MAG: hypothetical protein UR55_C0001G0058 [Candidatus Nomurabacteria bacterium GW2011_GWF1_34_20]KKP63767.1 MAG: hypothetical protein UR57_C0001G0058 [Candidatus Nomurabacteria bacterium GW2011_GWE2_34_25]KKP66979.1 MAG: hypothetical protein UR64_C0001G0058 [Candidatus Nomurabacteria bacterium GW2011_GWE1_35_16]HAE36801.1 hypothetical protein [Candidatus Nomurabacteria bacterium]HAX65496.1 hypothetical protein [Candidatus Nomurabacteria bacterium]